MHISPQDIINFTLQTIAWLVVLTIPMSFVEHIGHRIFMHKLTFLSRRSKVLKKTLDHHVVLHHGQYYKSFHDEPVPHGEDRGIRLSIREGFLEALPISALIAIFSLHGAVMFQLVVVMHHYLWNKIHIEMHKPQGRFFSNWPLYQFHARHHLLHHRHPDKNFNVVFLLADYVMGVTCKPNKSDLLSMYNSGVLNLTEAEVAALREEVNGKPQTEPVLDH